MKNDAISWLGRAATRALIVFAVASSPACGPRSTATPSAAPNCRPPLGSDTAIPVEMCTAEGGRFVPDPGDYSIHQPGFRCPDGQPAFAAVMDGTFEGGVCCLAAPGAVCP